MNSFRSLGRAEGSRFGLLVALGLAVGLIGMFAMAQNASASSVICGGDTTRTSLSESENALEYAIQCTEDIKGYSIISNREMNYFSTEVTVFDGEATLEGQSFQCEGSIPSYGIGCFGKATAGAIIRGSIGTSEELCEASVQPKFWIVALTTEVKGSKTVTLTSEPYQIPIKCDTLNAKKKAKDKAIKLCAKVKTAKTGKSRAKARKRCQAALAASKKLNQA